MKNSFFTRRFVSARCLPQSRLCAKSSAEMGIDMEKTATLNLRINPTVKQRAEDVLTRLGIPMSTAIDIYLNQISLTGGIPFAVTLPNAPSVLNADLMTAEEIHKKLQEGYDDIQAGGVQDAVSAFTKFRESH